MKALLWFLFLFPLFAEAQQDSLCKSWVRAEKRHYHALKQFKQSSSAEYNYNTIYQRCNWIIEPGKDTIGGDVTTWFKPGYFGFNRISFDLSQSLVADSAIFHGAKRNFTHSSDQLSISLDSLANGITDSVTVFYHGSPQDGGFYASVHGALSIPLTYTLSEPYEAKNWWPCKQSLNDKIDSIDIFVTTPKPNLVGSNGLLVGIQDLGSAFRYHWKERYPIAAYLVGIASTDYAADTDFVAWSPTDSFPIINYFYPEDSPRLFQQAKQAVPIMKLFINLFGRYPFDKEKYGHCEFGFFGGMEHQTMSFMANMDFSLVAHEMAHHWFGDKVTCYSWRDVWLNEGFATWVEGLAEQLLAGNKAWESWKADNRDAAMHFGDGSVLVNDTTNEDRIFSSQLSYAKGSMLLHMLRFMLGDSVLFPALRNYLNDPALAYGYATTDQLRHHLEQASGQDLKYFFDEWYSGKGYPLITISWTMEGAVLKLQVHQETTDPSVPFFHIPLPLQVFIGGHDSILVLKPQSKDAFFNIDLHGPKADSLQADPEKWILARFAIHHGNAEQEQIRIEPNPADKLLKLEIISPGLVSGNYYIYDALGRLCLNGPVSEGLTSIDLYGLRKGVYAIHFRSENRFFTGKFIRL